MHLYLPKHHGEMETSQPINRFKRKEIKFNNRGSEIGLKEKHSGYIQKKSIVVILKDFKSQGKKKRPKLYRRDQVKILNRLICKCAHNAAVRFTKQESKMAVDVSNMKSTLKRQKVKTELSFACIHTLSLTPSSLITTFSKH